MESSSTFRLDECEVESTLSSTSSRHGSSAADKYVLKTLCFARKSLAMPSKEEYSLLLTNGLGARKWQVGLNSDAEEFRRAILNIYPRLATTTGYTLWNVKKDKTFEKLPVKVNTPSRIRAYLGYQFTGCLIIMPLEELQLVPTLAGHGSRHDPMTDTDEVDSGYRSQNSGRHRQVYPSQSRASSTFTSSHRQFCLICRRTAKQQGSNSFYDINKQRMTTVGGFATVAEKLMELLNISLPRTDVVASEEICRRCYRQINEIDFLESQLKRSKAEFIGSFFQKLVASHRPRESSGGNETCHRIGCESFSSENLCLPQRVYLTPAAYRDAFERLDKNQSGFSSRTLNIVPVRLNYGATQIDSMSDCFPMTSSEKSSTIARRPSADMSHREREDNRDEADGDEDQGRDHRDRWYASDARDHRSAEENDEQEEEQTIDVVGSKRRGHGSNDKDAAKFDEETAAAVARVEAKRKGVARVEAFLDMMTFKGGSDAAGDARNDVGSVSKMTTIDEAKNLSTATSSSQSPSPPTFSSSSPEDSMNSHALSKIMARPRPWKKRHRHFEIETSQSDGGGPTNNQAQEGYFAALSQSRPAKREFETSRSPISHKLMRPSKDPTEKSSKSVSDEENTGTSFSSGSDSSISSNKSGAGGGGVGVGGVVGVGVGNGKAEKKSFD